MPSESALEAVDLTLLQLLERFPDQWATVVTAVEEARRAGARVIAVAGHQRGEGRTTLVQGLGLLLAERGWQVTCFATAAAWWRELVGPEASGRHCLPPAAVGVPAQYVPLISFATEYAQPPAHPLVSLRAG